MPKFDFGIIISLNVMHLMIIVYYKGSLTLNCNLSRLGRIVKSYRGNEYRTTLQTLKPKYATTRTFAILWLHKINKLPFCSIALGEAFIELQNQQRNFVLFSVYFMISVISSNNKIVGINLFNWEMLELII